MCPRARHVQTINTRNQNGLSKDVVRKFSSRKLELNSEFLPENLLADRVMEIKNQDHSASKCSSKSLNAVRSNLLELAPYLDSVQGGSGGPQY